MKGKYANIIVDIAHEKVDRPFQYLIPEKLSEKLSEGMAVTIPFGRGNKPVNGYVLEITDRPEYDPGRLKEIMNIRESELGAEAEFIRLAAWMKKTYGGTMITALKTVLPVRKKSGRLQERTILLSTDKETAQAALSELVRKHQSARARLLEALLVSPLLPYQEAARLKVSAKTVRELEEAGLLRVQAERRYRNPVTAGAGVSGERTLSERQREIAEAVWRELSGESPGVHLIHGITGSGKTRIYLELIERVVKSGRQAIVLVPEIALTYQTVRRFTGRFGDRVSVMNSRLSEGEKYDQFERAKKGEIDVMIGPRSALFTPFERLGLIVMDEEHESSYKSESVPKYHARETAAYIAGEHGAGLVLGSATPSLESYSRALAGEYHLYGMKERHTGETLPTVYTVDLREELKQGNRSIFSRKLSGLLEQRLERGEQSMLFINRRGYAGFISCRSCGYVVKCPHCDVSLTEHAGGRLQCHYCGYEENKPAVCPECGSKYILGFRAGTEQIEEQLKRSYPRARVLRMDADTTRGKDSYEKILSAFAGREADILVGTQMIVKGHDFPAVTLVGILAADMSLSAGDYRAAERTFQLLTQAAGRAGRGERPGEVVIQTYQPEHYSIVHAAAQDYEGFYREEIEYREMLQYPPAAHMLAVQVSAPEKEEAERLAGRLADLARSLPEKASVIGPAAAFMGKLKDRYRFAVYIKHREYGILVRIKDSLEVELKEQENRKESVQFDFDPVNGY